MATERPEANGDAPVLDTLSELFDHAVATHGTRPAAGTLTAAGWEWTTYAQLGELVASCRAGLALRDVGRGDRIAVICDNRIEWLIAAHAAYQRRAIFVPMYESQSDEEWRFILEDAGARVCIVANASIARRVARLREDLLDLQHVIAMDGETDEADTFLELLARGAGRAIKARKPQPSDVATIIYTSGTSGQPKGVCLTHRSLARNAAVLARHREYGPEAVSMAFLPWAHVFGGQVELNVMFAVGGAVAICQSADVLFRELANVQPTVLYAVPRVWTRLYHDLQHAIAGGSERTRRMVDEAVRLRQRARSGQTLPIPQRIYLQLAERSLAAKVREHLGGRIRWAVSGAAPLPLEVAEFFEGLGIVIHEGYGLTESSGSSTTNPNGAARFGTVGKPLPGTRVQIDARGDDGEGEIIIYGPGVMQGYHNQPEATAAVLTSDGGLRTGDVGRLDEDGYLRITGRLKELYKLDSGRYIAPAPLEETLKLSPFIAQCMVYGDGQPYNVALIGVDARALAGHFGEPPDAARTLLAKPETRQLIEDEVLRHSRSFRTFELVRKFWLELEPFTVRNGLLTPTLKLRRTRVLARYEAKLRSLY